MSRPGGRAILTGLHSIYQWRQVERRAARRSFTYPYLDVLVRIAEGVERLSPRPVAGGFPPGPLVGGPEDSAASATSGRPYVRTSAWFDVHAKRCPCGVDYGDDSE